MQQYGETLVPGQDGYEQAAAVTFATGTPDLIVRPESPAQVAAALAHARAHKMPVSVRSGGHSAAGLSTNTEGMVIDLSRISDIAIIDKAEHRVRIGGGATWGAVAAALAPDGLAITAGDTRQVGVGGLTLGGGVGWLVRRFGLAIDSLVAAEVVTADGQVLTASADEHADLFWALRGGGGNFGVVTSFEFIAQPLAGVQAGHISYAASPDPAEMAGFIRQWHDLMRSSDEDLTSTLSLVPAMMGRPPAVLLAVCYAGPDAAAAARALAPLRALGTVTSDDVQPKEYQDVLEDAMQLPPGFRLESDDILVRDVTSELAGALAALFAGGGVVLQLRAIGGALARVPAAATAFAHRDADLMIVGVAFQPPGAAPVLAAAWAPVAAHGTGSYVNFLSSASAREVAAAYPPDTYRRLAEVKGRYDPDNVFRRNHNIQPQES